VRVPVRQLAVICCLLVCVGTIASVGVAIDGDDVSPTTGSPQRSAELFQQSPENGTVENQTEHHRQLGNTSEEGSREAIKRWLASSMTDRLERNAINVSQGEYQLGQAVLGEGFEEDLERYVNVAGETESQEDDRIADTFNETRQTQRNFTEQASEFQRVYEDYQAALAAGETNRARELAKRLDRLASRINETSRTLTDRYGSLANETGVSFDDGQRTVQNLTNRTVAEAENVVEETLVRTELQVESVSPLASYPQPLVIEGQYVAVNGTAISGAEIVLATPGPESNATTTTDSEFELRHRPVDLETGVRNLTVSAIPSNGSVYLPATTTITSDIQAVKPDVSISDAGDGISYGEQANVTVDVTVADRPGVGVPVDITIDGTVLATGRTDDTGTLRTAVELPAGVRNGSRDFTVRVGTAGRAIAPATATRSVIVERTATTTTLAVTNGSTIGLGGSVSTAEGVPITNRPVQIQVDGTVIETVRTNATGAFTTTLESRAVPTNEPITVTAVYDEPASNLDPSQASAIAEQFGDSSSPPEQDNALGDGIVLPVIAGVGTVLIVILAGTVYLQRRESPSPSGREPTVDPSRAETVSSAPATIADIEAALERHDIDEATVSLYAFVLEQLPTEARPDQTPRERYRSVADSLSPEKAAVFESVTDLYERARFAPTTVSATSIETAVADVREGFEERDVRSSDD